MAGSTKAGLKSKLRPGLHIRFTTLALCNPATALHKVLVSHPVESLLVARYGPAGARRLPGHSKAVLPGCQTCLAGVTRFRTALTISKSKLVPPPQLCLAQAVCQSSVTTARFHSCHCRRARRSGTPI